MVSPKVKKEDSSPEVKTERGEFTESTHPDQLDNTLSSEDDDEVQILENGDEFYDSIPNQLVLYNPEANGAVQQEPVSDPINYTPPPPSAYAPYTPRVLPSVGAFTVQCANCFKWRLIPTKEKYEEIRESILQVPFVCERAREWRPDISCDDPADISQDGSRLWAIDKPNIAQPPPGWERLLRIRGEGSTRFADVYYVAPSGKRLRSMVEIQKFLLENPQYCAGGVQMSQFSFQIPKPLQENYVRKRPRADYSMSPAEVSPLSWAGPTNEPQLQLGQPGMSSQYMDNPVSPPTNTPKKKRTKSPANSRHMYNNNTPRMKSEEPQFDNTALNL